MLSEAMRHLGENRSVIRDLFEYGSQRAKLVGADHVYDYSLGNPSIPAPEEVGKAIIEIVEHESPVAVHGYTSAVGSEETRKAIADDLNQRFGTSYTPGELYITCGAAASLISVIKALLAQPDSEILTIAPFFPEYRCFVEASGGVFRVVPADEEQFQIHFDALEQMLTPKTQALLINSPNNPSGTVYSEETIRRLAALLTEKSKTFGHPIYLISDEPYRELVYDGEPAPFVPLYYPNTVICYSYSKSLSLPGERIGYVLVPRGAEDGEALYSAVAGAARASGYVCAPSLMQKVIARCATIRPDLEEYRKNRDLLYQSLTAMGYRCVYPKGAFYLFMESPTGDGNTFSEIAKEFDLLLVPGETFGCKRFLRLSYCVSGDMIRRSLPAFEKALQKALQG